MPTYADGFVIPVPKRKLEAYRKMAQLAAQVWKEHGALDYKECVLEDSKVMCGPGFPKGTKLKRGETVVFAWIVYKSRKHRDQVNARVMKDERLAAACDPKNPPFDMQRMLHGGFETIVEW